MSNEKRETTVTVNTLQEDNIYNDANYTLYLHSKLQKSQDDIRKGRVMTIRESEERMKRKYAGFNIK